MSDIFLSYAREDHHQAKALAQALEKHGWSVWWDTSIPAGRVFDEVIEEAIGAARCVVVLWSRHSVGSRWVKSEAAEGANRGALVPVLLEDVRIPLAFRRIQTADLTGWKVNDAPPAKLIADIGRVLDTPPAAGSGHTAAGPGRDPTDRGADAGPATSSEPARPGGDVVGRTARVAILAAVVAAAMIMAYRWLVPNVTVTADLYLLAGLIGLLLAGILNWLWLRIVVRRHK